MTRKINCVKLGKEAPGLEFPPMPGELGQKIYESISAEAWGAWMNHQTMLINEYRLNMTDSKSRKFLVYEMQKFLFTGEESSKPEGYIPPNEGTA